MAQFPAVFELSSLDGTNGFQINGEAWGDQSGESVSSAGDVNGDGFDDLIIGGYSASPNGSFSGASYVVFGNDGGFAAELELSTLDGKNGFQINGEAKEDWSGSSVSSAGDVNGDGFDDLIIGANGADPHGEASGASYVVFGKDGEFAANLELSTLDGKNGFQINGEAKGDQNDWGRCSVSSAGDVNGDGLDDLIIGASKADPHGEASGASYVVFGKDGEFAANLEFSTLDGKNGFQINGEAEGDRSGYSVSSAGDVNGDGFDDLIIGAREADPNGASSGVSYVVFGENGGFAANLDLSTLDGKNGFQINGEAEGDLSGHSVSSAGDVNGDGFDDLIVGAPLADPHGGASGASYVVFGRDGGFAASLELSTLDGTNGFQISGEAKNDLSGWSVSSAGDVNGDGFDDLIIGARSAVPNGERSGASYVVLGWDGGFAANLDLSTLGGAYGFQMNGELREYSGWSVSSAGDVDGDGFDDLIIGARWAGPNGNYSGASYVVFGHANAGAVPDDFAIAENGTVTGDLFADNGHRTDTVAPGNPLEITEVNGSAANVGGKLALASGALIEVLKGGGFSYDTNGVFDELPAPASGASNAIFNDTFTYMLADGSIAEVTVAVSGLDNDDRLEGTAGKDVLNAGVGDDVVFGLAGGDTLAGGLGGDRLRGNFGKDVFDFNATAESGRHAAERDKIGDFRPGADRIDLSTIDAMAGTGGNQAFTFIGTEAFTAEGQVRLVLLTGYALVLVNTTGNSGADMSIALRSFTAAGLADADFVL